MVEKYLEEMNTLLSLKVSKNIFSALSREEKTGSFDMNDLFQDLHFIFKRSGARREDYASLESITAVTAEYMKE